MGSDAVYSMFGQNTRELEWFVKAGMTPEQALATATTIGAELLGQEDRLGRVAPGFAADIVAIDGDPLANITRCRHGRALGDEGRRGRRRQALAWSIHAGSSAPSAIAALTYDEWMQSRTFGRTGWQVSEVGYGMWGMAGWTGSDDEESFASLDRAIELGCNFFDTAWAYGDGHSERLLGETLKRHPRQAALRRHQDPAEEPQVAGARRATRSTTSSPPTTSASTPRRACRTSACRRSTSSSSTSGTTSGRPTSAGSARVRR